MLRLLDFNTIEGLALPQSKDSNDTSLVDHLFLPTKPRSDHHCTVRTTSLMTALPIPRYLATAIAEFDAIYYLIWCCCFWKEV
jgi:hypothetical protein